MEGNWKAVSCTGAEAFADALGEYILDKWQQKGIHNDKQFIN